MTLNNEITQFHSVHELARKTIVLSDFPYLPHLLRANYIVIAFECMHEYSSNNNN